MRYILYKIIYIFIFLINIYLSSSFLFNGNGLLRLKKFDSKLYQKDTVIEDNLNIETVNNCLHIPFGLPTIHVIGISHKSSSLENIEKIKLDKHQSNELKEKIYSKGLFDEIIVLSTCNRFELYLISLNEKIMCKKNLTDLILENSIKNINNKDKNILLKEIFIKKNIGALNHIGLVSSGLDSMVFGENQILTQVKNTYLEILNDKKKHSLKYLPLVFEKSIICGKKIRSELNLLQKNSISSIAISFANNLGLNKLTDIKIVVIGNGNMASLLIDGFKEYPNLDITLVGRNKTKSIELLNRHQALKIKIIDFSELNSKLYNSDFVFVCTSSCGYIIDKNNFSNKHDCQINKKLVVIDISVPRNVNPNVKQIGNLILYDIDDLKTIQSNNNNITIKQATHIINIESNKFYKNLVIENVLKEVSFIKEELINLTENTEQLNITKKDICHIFNRIFNKIRNITNK
jgi:glutamyl-tRNA reductase